MPIRLLLLCALSLVVLLVACAPTATPVPSATRPTATLSSELPSPPASPTPAATRYYNAAGKFSLDLPAGWEVLGPLPVDRDPNRPYDLYILGPDPVPSGGPGMSRIVIADAQQWSPEHFAQSQCSTCPAHPFEQVTLGGRPAQHTQIGGGGVPFTISWYFVENNGQLIGLAIHNPETLHPLEAVIQSIQFE